MQEIQFYFTKITIIGLGINDAFISVSLIRMGPAESAYLSNILSLKRTFCDNARKRIYVCWGIHSQY